MKARLLILPILFIAAGAQGAVSLSISGTTGSLGNFLNGAGSADGNAARMVWGVIVDTDRNGFAGGVDPANPYMHGFSLAANVNGMALTTLTGGASDDVMFIASVVMATTTSITDGNPSGTNRALSFTGLNFSGGVGANDPFAIVWFDSLALGGTAAKDLKYGVYIPPATDLSFGKANALPSVDGTFIYSPAFAGADPAKKMDYQLGTAVPEASTVLLGALGALGLLRRRR